MLRAIIIVLSYAFLTLLTSCGDDPVNTEVNNNLVTVQLVESGTKKPIANQKIGIYYALEYPSSLRVNNKPVITDYQFDCSPSQFSSESRITFNLTAPSIVSLTLNNPINDTIIKDICKTSNYNIGFYSFDVDTDGLESQVFKAKLFVNNSLVDSLTIIKSKDYFVTIYYQISDSYYGKPFINTITDANGNFTVDISKFRYFGQRFIRTDYTGRTIGIFEVINGFQAITEFDDGNRKEEYTVRLSNRLTNNYIWKIDNN